MITSVKEILQKAREGGYAVGAFNTVNLETTKAIVEAAKEMRSPLIIQVTEKTIDYAGGRAIFNLIKNCAEFYAPEIPIGIHLDHGKSFEIVQRAAGIGFGSVMYDGSRKDYEDNLVVTKKVVEFCHDKGIDVQAELGNVPYIGEGEIGEINWEEYMTDPGQVKSFVAETGVDALAVAIGNAHGFFKERSAPDYTRLEMIHKNVEIPLILHGASDWESDRVEEVIKRGIVCFNVDTATRIAFVNSLMRVVKDQNDISFDVRKILGDAREAVKQAVIEKIKIFGSDGRI
ncbi:MAG TPA: class II fructose-bisphosphate aldolase [Patescibacteria group bacterium]